MKSTLMNTVDLLLNSFRFFAVIHPIPFSSSILTQLADPTELNVHSEIVQISSVVSKDGAASWWLVPSLISSPPTSLSPTTGDHRTSRSGRTEDNHDTTMSLNLSPPTEGNNEDLCEEREGGNSTEPDQGRGKENGTGSDHLENGEKENGEKQEEVQDINPSCIEAMEINQLQQNRWTIVDVALYDRLIASIDSENRVMLYLPEADGIEHGQQDVSLFNWLKVDTQIVLMQ